MPQVRNATEANLMYVASEIERMGNDISISEDIQKFSVQLYIQAIQSNYNPKAIDRASATCLYAAAKIHDQPVTIDNIAEVSRRNSENIYQEAKSLSKVPGIQIEPNDPANFVKEFADELGWDQEVKEHAEELCEKAKDDALHSGCSPTGFAASVLYARSEIDDLGYTQKEICDVAEVRDVTIRNQYRDIMRLAPDVDAKDLASRDFEASFVLIEETFELPADICDQARDRALSVEGNEITRGSSHAGIAAAAYLEAISDTDIELDSTEFAEALGVSPTDVAKYRGVV